MEWIHIFAKEDPYSQPQIVGKRLDDYDCDCNLNLTES